MKSSMNFFVVSLLTIGVGAAWLLNLLPATPNAHWVWPMAMGLAGLMLIALCGVNKLTIVTGPLLIVASVFTLMRQTGTINVSQEMPAMVIAMGMLMLASVIAPSPAPDWAGAQTKK